MDTREFAEIFSAIANDVDSIAHNQMVIAGIHTELRKNAIKPFEQDLIYEDHFGQKPSEPRRFIWNGVKITSQVLHQTGIGLRDVVGADLMYEIEDEKFMLIQYKKAYEGTVKADNAQLGTLLDNCPSKCMHRKKRPIPYNWVPLKLNSFCGCWYCVIDGEIRRYVHACEAEAIFQNKGSAKAEDFQIGLTRESFLELFSSCRTGALLRPATQSELRAYIDQLISDKHFVFTIQQHGQWSKDLLNPDEKWKSV